MSKLKKIHKILDLVKEKKVIGCLALLVIFFGISFFIYGQSKNKVFKDQYMKDIFVEDNSDNKSENVSVNLDKDSKLNSSSEKVVLKKGQVTVEIKGEVKSPKVYTLDEGAIINDLIEMAGGLTTEANTSNINRAKVLKNEDLIIIGNNKEIDTNSPNDMKMTNGNGIVNSNDSSKSGIININTASLSELMNIDGVGEKTAQKIIDYREENGGFKSIEDIKNVDRIGDKTFEKIKKQISC
ncbi:MAG: helix-hairpin-helix domain-containing protein [Clostridium sp.]